MVDIKDYIEFESKKAKRDKLKEWGVISAKSKDKRKIMYKDKECTVLGYISKKTNIGCLSPVYETVVISVDDEIIKISIGYLKDMQDKQRRGRYE